MNGGLSRRDFVAGSAAVLGTPELARPATRQERAPVHLDRLTSREVGEWMKTNDVAFVPHGPISGHGPWTTLGAHPHAAEAVCVLMARKCGGVVYPPVFTAFAGATRMYPGTVPFTYEFHVQVLKAVVRALYAQGFGRIFLVCHTNPEDAAGLIAARDLFDCEGEVPVASLVGSKGMSSEPVRKLLEGYPGSVGEALLDYAAMRIL